MERNMLLDILTFLVGAGVIIIMGIFAYMSCVLVSEKKVEPGKFDKQGVVKYNKGDNT